MDRFLSALLTFVLFMVGQFFALAAVEGFGGLRIFPFGSRTPLLVLMLGVAFGAAILRWKMLGARKRSTPPDAATVSPVSVRAQPTLAEKLDPARLDPASILAAIAASSPPQAAAPPRSERGDDLIAAAARQAIVFRQHFPPRHDPAIRSYFGGAPVTPRGFLWPRSGNQTSQGKPLHFLMQVDCAAIPAAARLGALPSRGVLYFFLDLSWTTQDARVIYADFAGNDWETLAPPADLGPAFGENALYNWRWAQTVERCPVLLPRWTFDPIRIELPERVRDENEDDDEAGPALWPERLIAELLLEAQGDATRYEYLTIKDVVDGKTVRRPFPAFPQDWRALQICSAEIVHQADQQRRYPSMSTFRTMDKDEKDALLAAISAEAQSWLDRATTQEPFDAVPSADRDAFWEFVARHSDLSRSMLVNALTDSLEASLAHSDRAAARVPLELAARIRGRHALAVTTDAGIHANIPHRMLAPPVDVQGNQYERAQTHLLLLEISSNEGLAHHFGEGVFQFWIRPEDLQAGRFDKVELTADAY